SHTPVSTITAPTGSYQCNFSPSTAIPRITATTGDKYVTDAAVVAPLTRTTLQHSTYAKLVPKTPRPTSPHSATELSAKVPAAGVGSRSAKGNTSGTENAICTATNAVEDMELLCANRRESTAP